MRGLGEGIAFAATVAIAGYMSVVGDGAELLWLLVVVWALHSNWGAK